MTTLTHKEALEILAYDGESGLLTWKIRAKSTRPIGSLVGSLRKDGYLGTAIRGKHYLLHRLAWFWMTGEWPSHEIDHINGDKADNRWSNLRAATRHQNIQNRGPHRDNSAGMKGVHFSKKEQKWVAQIYAAGQRRRLGCFDCPAAASFAYQIAAEKFHGEFAQLA